MHGAAFMLSCKARVASGCSRWGHVSSPWASRVTRPRGSRLPGHTSPTAFQPWRRYSDTPPLYHIPATRIPIHRSKVVLWQLGTELQTMFAEII